MSAYLARLKRIEIEKQTHYARNSKPSKGSEGPSESFEGTHTAFIQKKYVATDQWREFESLLAIVGPSYRTPDHEYAEMRTAARNDLARALIAYRVLARQVAANA